MNVLIWAVTTLETKGPMLQIMGLFVGYSKKFNCH